MKHSVQYQLNPFFLNKEYVYYQLYKVNLIRNLSYKPFENLHLSFNLIKNFQVLYLYANIHIHVIFQFFLKFIEIY